MLPNLFVCMRPKGYFLTIANVTSFSCFTNVGHFFSGDYLSSNVTNSLDQFYCQNIQNQPGIEGIVTHCVILIGYFKVKRNLKRNRSGFK